MIGQEEDTGAADDKRERGALGECFEEQGEGVELYRVIIRVRARNAVNIIVI